MSVTSWYTRVIAAEVQTTEAEITKDQRPDLPLSPTRLRRGRGQEGRDEAGRTTQTSLSSSAKVASPPWLPPAAGGGTLAERTSLVTFVKFGHVLTAEMEIWSGPENRRGSQLSQSVPAAEEK